MNGYVWNRGYTLYPSSITKNVGGLKQDRLTSLPYENILSSLIYQAHRQNLRLVPWFEYGLMIPTTSKIAQEHPDWLTTTRNEETVINYNPTKPRWILNSLFNFAQEITGANQGWLNPFHPEVQEFIRAIQEYEATLYLASFIWKLALSPIRHSKKAKSDVRRT